MKKIVVVTGANKGLGLSNVRTLVEAGYYVIATSRSESTELLALQGSLCKIVKFDFENVQDIHGLSREIRRIANEEFEGAIYGLVNNAALGTDGVLGTMHASDIEKILKVNVQAPILLTKFMTRQMLLHQVAGRVVNIGSIISSTGYSGLSVYGATKAALEGFTRSLAREVGKRGITVNVVAPGFMHTDMTSGLGDSHLDKIKRRSALGEFASTDSVSSMVEYLLSGRAAHITGTVVTVDAGSTA